ncbi:class I SAM-dependent methyltransferase [Desertivirga xinjiangensis]|uniref:class I SAM-dependent methyltransferase n=1 Tax=Desertivirga xinjiangensis TaxID=539206 RepID=UPI00210BDD44|nr:class I SAM-dependent methyltransferase [Pedobacter xinjiangensis]
MKEDYSSKSTVEEIRTRFDNDVERFSNLETAQQTVIDAQYCLEIITEAVSYLTPKAKSLLDIGCGAGNYSLKMLRKIPQLSCTLIDLSLPMLLKAQERITKETGGTVNIFQSDIREVDLPEEEYCVAMAGSVLHHLRDDSEWELVFNKIYRALKPGASFWICDLVVHDVPAIQQLFKDNYGDFLEGLGGKDYREKVLAYIEREDSPRSVNFQMDLMKKVGFRHVELLHKNACFAAFGGIK